MKIATWNVNSLGVRLPQVLDWLVANPVDVLCLQELKLSDEKFPTKEIEAAGYHSAFFGQKTYNGVAILSRCELGPARDVVKNISGFVDEQSRVIAVTLNTPESSQGEVRVVNGYFVNGQEPGSEKVCLQDEVARRPACGTTRRAGRASAPGAARRLQHHGGRPRQL